MKLYAKSEPIYSMAQIGQNEKPAFCIWVNPDQDRIGDPYFKMYDSQRYTTAKRSIRIGIKAPKLIYHKDGKGVWAVTTSDMKYLDAFMSKKSRKYLGYTNWESTIFDWNYEYGFITPATDSEYASDIDAFFGGYYDTSKNLNHPSYVPSTTKQPTYADLIP